MSLNWHQFERHSRQTKSTRNKCLCWWASIHGGDGRFQALSLSHSLLLKIVLHAKIFLFAGTEFLCKSRRALPHHVLYSTETKTTRVGFIRCDSPSAVVKSMSTALRWKRLLFFDFWLNSGKRSALKRMRVTGDSSRRRRLRRGSVCQHGHSRGLHCAPAPSETVHGSRTTTVVQVCTRQGYDNTCDVQATWSKKNLVPY
jgi:hypothetical protein